MCEDPSGMQGALLARRQQDQDGNSHSGNAMPKSEPHAHVFGSNPGRAAGMMVLSCVAATRACWPRSWRRRRRARRAPRPRPPRLQPPRSALQARRRSWRAGRPRCRPLGCRRPPCPALVRRNVWGWYGTRHMVCRSQCDHWQVTCSYLPMPTCCAKLAAAAPSFSSAPATAAYCQMPLSFSTNSWSSTFHLLYVSKGASKNSRSQIVTAFLPKRGASFC